MTNHPINKIRKYKKAIIVLLIALLVLLTGLYLSRAWLRTTGITWYANTFIQPTVEKQFNKNLGYVNERLTSLGVKVDKPGPSDGCSGSQYEGFRVSLACSKSASSGKVHDDEQFVKNWQQKTQEFEDDLLTKGWKRINYANQSISQLLDPAAYQPEIVYELKMGKVSCYARIGYNKYDEQNRRIFVDEYCYRPVKIFGGY